MNKRLKAIGVGTLLLMRGMAAGLALLIAFSMVMPQKAQAIFGIGDIVFDPTTWAETVSIWDENVSTLAKVTEEAETAVKIYNNAMQIYTLAEAMAHSFNGASKGQWLTLAQMAVADHVKDLQSAKGENGPWSDAMDGDPAKVPAAWQAATLGLKDVSAIMSAESVGHSPGLSSLATLNALDGSAMKCMSTISQYRGNSLVNQLGPVLKLAIQHFDGTATTNSEVEQLNLVNGHANQANQEARAQGQVQACLVETQMLGNKIQRDQIAENLNFQADVAVDRGIYNPFGGNVSSSLATHIPR